MKKYKLVIGNRNYSSWSLRAWLYLKESGLEKDCSVVLIPIYADNYKEKVLEHSPSGRVPCLIDYSLSNEDGIAVWDSLAIMEHIRDIHDSAIGWPTDEVARATARSITMEMHSGFLNIRDELPQNLKKIDLETCSSKAPVSSLSDACKNDIRRVDEIWQTCLDRYGGPWLFGETLTIADIMYIPVALRFVAYGVSVSETSHKFIECALANEAVGEWIASAEEESYVLEFIDNLVPASDSPLVL